LEQRRQAGGEAIWLEVPERIKKEIFFRFVMANGRVRTSPPREDEKRDASGAFGVYGQLFSKG
jgi:hypothetical protein